MDQNPYEPPRDPSIRRSSIVVLSLNFTTACLIVSIVAGLIETEPDSFASYLANILNWLSLCGAAIGVLVATAAYIPWRNTGR